MTLINHAESYVFELFKHKLPNTYVYHNFLHTQRVVKSAAELCKHVEISENEKLGILLAAWFHDTGYVNSRKDHEKESVLIFKQFSAQHSIADTLEKIVGDCILATRLGVAPQTPLEEICKDADSSHLAKSYFREVSELLRQELYIQGVATYTVKTWEEKNIALLSESHQFYTRYATEQWGPKKAKNLVDLLKKKQKRKEKVEKEITKAKLKAKFKEESPERGIQTLFRVTLRNHIKLSDIADTKANILLSVNAIIISLALANLIPKLDSPTNRHLMLPSLILILFSVASIIMSIMATQPSVTEGEFTKGEVKKKKVNLLFFGNFYKMKYEQYQWAIDEMIKDKSYVYTMLTKDLYLLGLVLKRKYTLLKTTYIVFTLGIIISVIAFIVAFITL